MHQFTPEAPRIAVDETALAVAIGMSVAFLRKDRRTKRLLPFYRLGGAIRYDLTRVRESLAALEEGGTKPTPRKATAGAAT